MASPEEQAVAGPTAAAAAAESAAAEEAAEEDVSLEDQLWQKSQELQLAQARITEVEQKVREPRMGPDRVQDACLSCAWFQGKGWVAKGARPLELQFACLPGPVARL